ncbi:MAG: flavodoxin family protein [Candidatus Glassbacteria bacterium]|nr:flavodoxin family protein [Candidatus Glassbacteria bacterium]
MNKLLGIVGSPRRQGNTHVLVSEILEAACQEGAEAELVFLDSLEIAECDGCHACWKGPGCSKGDDMSGLYPKIAESGVLIFGTPVYWYGPTALIKAFLDRLVYFNCPENRVKISGKKAALAVPFEENDLGTADLLVAMFEKSLQYLEMELAGKIIVPGVTLRGEVQHRKETLEECRRLGRRLAQE